MLRRADGAEAALRPKTLEVLRFLLSRSGHLVSRGEILDTVWAGLHVTDDSITQCAVELRQALGPDAALLRTVPKRGYVLETGPPPALSGGVPVLAVMPFRPLGADADLAALADGLLETVVGTLAALREPAVIAAASTRQLALEAPDIAAVAARLGAHYVATGSVRRAGGTVRVAVEMIAAETGTVEWRRALDLPDAEGLPGEDRVAAAIAHALAPRIGEAELRRALRLPPGSRAAYHLLLEARRLMFRMEPAGFEEAGAMLRRAVELDPAFPPGHATLADWHSLRIGQGWSPDREADTRAMIAAAEAAIELDAGHARALALLGHNHVILSRRYEAALPLFARALDAAPHDADAWMWSAPSFAWMGEGDEAVRRAERALALSPEDPLRFRHRHFLSIGHYVREDFAAAAEWGLRSREENPHYTSNLRVTAAALAAEGRREEARALAREVLALEPEFHVAMLIARQPMRDEGARHRYGHHLQEAGLPP